jgi:hypothetical protein
MILHIAIGCLTLAVLLLIADYLAGRWLAYRKRRDEFIRNERLNRYNVAAFRGTRKFDDPRWPS